MDEPPMTMRWQHRRWCIEAAMHHHLPQRSVDSGQGSFLSLFCPQPQVLELRACRKRMSRIYMNVVLCRSRAEEIQSTPRQPIEPAGKATAHEAGVSALLRILERYR